MYSLTRSRRPGCGVGSGSGSGVTPPSQPCAILYHFDGENGATNFLDSSGNGRNAIIGAGSPVISTAQSKFGGSSLYVPNNSFLLASGVPIGAGDFTVEFWARLDNGFDDWTGLVGQGLGWSFSDWTFAAYGGNVAWWRDGAFFLTSTQAPAAGTWNHYAVCRQSQLTKLYLNGQNLSGGGTNVASSFSLFLTIGVGGTGGYTKYCKGAFFDEFRVTTQFEAPGKQDYP